jgi:AAA domain/UvrD-like helicase C-terminal domain
MAGKGGARAGAGRKPKTPTKMVRLESRLADRLLELLNVLTVDEVLDALDSLDGETLPQSEPILIEDEINVSPIKLNPLNPGQRDAIRGLIAWWEGRDKLASLSGAAGTGKTFLLGYLLQEISPKSVAFLAPTHKAKKVLKNSLAQFGIEGNVFTVAQSLGKQPIILDTGLQDFATKGHAFIGNYDLVICDEASMVKKDDYQEIFDNAERVLWLGDRNQLPPINEVESMAFSDYRIRVKPELSQVMRYTGHILNECEKLREGVNTGQIHSLVPDGETIKRLSKFEWLRLASEIFRSESFEKDTSFCRVLAYRNAIVDALNRQLKQLIYGHQKPFFSGQKLIANSPVSRLEVEDKKKVVQIKATNSEEMIVISEPIKRAINERDLELAPRLCQSHLTGEILSFQCECESGNKFDAIILLPSALLASQKLRTMIGESGINPKEKKANYQFLNAWGDNLRDIFAITIHKAQGSTYNHLFLDMADILKPSSKREPGGVDERPKLLYTAVSRASERIYLIH